MADERHKSAAFQHLCRKHTGMFFNELQFLVIRVSHGDNQPASFGKLSQQRLRNLRSSGRDEDAIEGREFRESECAVSTMNVDIVVAEPCKLFGCSRCQLWPQLDCKNLSRQMRKYRRLKTTSSSNLQHPIPGL